MALTPLASALVRIGLGILLLFAATIKGYELASSDVTFSLGAFPWMRLMIVNAEFLLGAALLLGLWADGIRRIASLCFFVFSAVALDKAVRGYPSCGCFGPLDVNPWPIFIFDWTFAK